VDPQQRIDLQGIQAHPWFCAPLPPPLQAGWQRAQQAQRELDARLAGLRPNQEAVQARNSLAHQLVREAAAWPEHWDQSLHRLAQAREGPKLRLALRLGFILCHRRLPSSGTQQRTPCAHASPSVAAGQQRL
jgi:hypothetical protein